MAYILTIPGIVDANLLLLLMARALPKPGPVEVKITFFRKSQCPVTLNCGRLIVSVRNEVNVLLMNQGIFTVVRWLIPLAVSGVFRQIPFIQKQINAGVIFIINNRQAVGIDIITSRCGTIATASQIAVTR